MGDDVVGEIVIGQGCWRSGKRIRDSVGLTSDVPDVAVELADKQELALGPQGPSGGGVGLADGAGQRLVVSIYYHLPPLNEVLELPDRCEDGQELVVEG